MGSRARRIVPRSRTVVPSRLPTASLLIGHAPHASATSLRPSSVVETHLATRWAGLKSPVRRRGGGSEVGIRGVETSERGPEGQRGGGEIAGQGVGVVGDAGDRPGRLAGEVAQDLERVRQVVGDGRRGVGGDGQDRGALDGQVAEEALDREADRVAYHLGRWVQDHRAHLRPEAQTGPQGLGGGNPTVAVIRFTSSATCWHCSGVALPWVAHLNRM